MIGSGDELALNVWHRPEVSDEKMLVGPDGIINVQRIGAITVNNRTRADVAREIQQKFAALRECSDAHRNTSQGLQPVSGSS